MIFKYEQGAVAKFVVLFCLWACCFIHGSDYVIHLPDNSIASEQTAARELQRFFSRLCGQKVDISTVAKAGRKLTFHLGQSPCTAEGTGIGSFSELRPDEIIIRRRGNDIYLTGDRPRGTLYAVHTFLEDYCGMRFFAPDETCYPEKFSLPSAIDHRYAPCFAVRETPFYAFRKLDDFSARRKLNGHFQKTSEAWGGHEVIWSWCHTFDRLMPVEKYGEKHPEYYSELDGKRRPVGNQLCLSNRGMRQELIKNVREVLRKNPGIKMVSISQNDCDGYCRCAGCKALAGKYGNTQSGPLIDLLNEIAGSLEKEFPRVYFETLAYAYSVEAPRNIRPRRNVIVRLCSDGCDESRALDEPRNAKFGRPLKEWSKIAPNLMVWNYVSLFYTLVSPNPNWNLHGRNLRFFRDHGVMAVFNQSSGSPVEDFAPLRAYVNSKLLWDPDLDESDLMREFIDAYYGPKAAPWLKKYLALMKVNHLTVPENFRLGWSSPAVDWLSYEDMETARHLMARAVQESDGKYRKRVQMAQNAIYFAFLMHPETPQRYKEKLEVPQRIFREFDQLTGRQGSFGETFNIVRLKESLKINYGLRQNSPGMDLPEQFRNLPENHLIVIDSSDLTAYGQNIQTFRKEGYVSMLADHRAWLVQFPDLAFRTRRQGKWRLYCEIRTGGTPEMQGKSCQVGIYYGIEKRSVSKRLSFEDVASKTFKLIDLGVHEFKTGREYFYCAPNNDSRATPIDIRRLYLVRQ